MASVSSPSASSTTASGLPANGRSVNTSSVAKRRRIEFSSLVPFQLSWTDHDNATRMPHRPLPRLRARDREGACNAIVHFRPPPPHPSPASGGGSRPSSYSLGCHFPRTRATPLVKVL